MNHKPVTPGGRIHPPARRAVALDAPALRRWGFQDTRFVWGRDGFPRLSGGRYPNSGVPMSKLPEFASRTTGVAFGADNRNVPLARPVVEPARPAPALLAALTDAIGAAHVCTDDAVRLRHGHGHTAVEIYQVNYGALGRVPDVVVQPGSTEEVAAIVAAASAHDAVVIPYGGGTSVTGALRPDPDDPRPVVSLDLGRMARIRWIDPQDRVACIEAGMIGRDVRTQLEAHGFTMGLEPDSIEFSTLGGWIATRASGMKGTRYGHIEAMVRSVVGVTAQGRIGTLTGHPRTSHGIMPQELWLGSEGTLGVITEAVVRVHAAPAVRRYGSLVFPDWHTGLAFLQALQHEGHPPASTRLVDNLQLQFGQALKPANKGFKQVEARLKRSLLTRVKGYDLERIVAVTLVYEGDEDEVAMQEASVRRLIRRFDGLDAGASSGADGYRLTFGIAYIRDFLMEHWIWGESFETSFRWSDAEAGVAAVKAAARRKHAELGLPGQLFMTSRISKIYPEGVCAYFYMGFVYKGVEDPIGSWHQLIGACREAILASGGSTSHHHGIGQERTSWHARVEDEATRRVRHQVKRAIDPDHRFGVPNQGLVRPQEGS